MPTLKADTPLGGTMTLGTQGGSYNFVVIGMPEETVAVIDVSHLATTNFREKIAGDLKDASVVTIRVQFVGIDGLPSIAATAETITLTYPNNDSTAAKYAGTGFLSRRKFPDMDIGAVDDIMVAEFDVVFNGGYGGGSEPAFTKAT